MNYKATVERRIAGKNAELGRRKELWAKIALAYERGGDSAIKSAMSEQGNSLRKESDELLRQLKAKL